MGDSTLTTLTHSFLLKDFLHVPSSTKNLIFVQKFYSDNPVIFEFHSIFFLCRTQRWECLFSVVPCITVSSPSLMFILSPPLLKILLMNIHLLPVGTHVSAIHHFSLSLKLSQSTNSLPPLNLCSNPTLLVTLPRVINIRFLPLINIPLNLFN